MSQVWRRWRARVLGLVLSLPVLVAAQASGVSIITSPDRGATPLERGLVRALFGMRLREWPDGTPVRVFVLPDSDPVHELFCREELGTYPYVLRTTWDRLVYTGTGVAPEVVHNEKEMRDRVTGTRGAIGYVSSQGSFIGPGPRLALSGGEQP